VQARTGHDNRNRLAIGGTAVVMKARPRSLHRRCLHPQPDVDAHIEALGQSFSEG
jgi:hypothetical protein